MGKEISIIKAQKPAATFKRVAAYARVSTDMDRQVHSLASQVSFYSNLIQKTPGWRYVGVYADEGITGTKMEGRTEFQRMLNDCESGKIDIILTKSVSRFARNTVDLLNTVRRLKKLGISVRFEKERLDTMTEDGELMLTLLASFAQEEVRSISENMRWSVIRNFRNGRAYNNFRIYGYRREGKDLVIEPSEAAVVERIYNDFIVHRSYEEIIRSLYEDGVSPMRGVKWAKSSIHSILTNITYTGNLVLMKYYVSNPISKQRKHNHGERDQYFAKDTHEAIIDMDTFMFVQDEMKRRKDAGFKENKSLRLTCFSGLIKCGECGKSYHRTVRNNPAKTESMYGDHYYIWRCGSRSGKVGVCKMKYIPEKVLRDLSAAVLGLDEFDDVASSERIDHIVVLDDTHLQFFFKDGSDRIMTWKRTASVKYLKQYKAQVRSETA